ncbi:MAG: hypothetical protein WCR98_04095 [Saccharofermentanales bacterium]
MIQDLFNQNNTPANSSAISGNGYFDERTEKNICSKAKSLVNTQLFQPYEQDDIKQKLRFKVSGVMQNYKPNLSNPNTFARKVTENHARNMINKRKQELKKQWGTSNPSDFLIVNCDIAGNSISTDDYDMSVGGKCRTAIELHDLETDVANFAETLLPIDRKLCKAILVESSINAAAKSLNISYSTAHKRLRTRIHKAAVDFGLGDFVGGGE